LLHKTIKKVTSDIEQFRFNTAISAMMILLNELEKNKLKMPEEPIIQFIKLLSPFAPHLAQELWQQLGKETLLDNEPWPVYDEKLTVDNEIQLLVQVNGKLKDKILVSKDITQEEAEKLGLAFIKNGTKKTAAKIGGNLLRDAKAIVIPIKSQRFWAKNS